MSGFLETVRDVLPFLKSNADLDEEKQVQS